jgi:hypothetical protein
MKPASRCSPAATRRDSQEWDREVVGLDGMLDLLELGGAVAVRDVYTDIVF